MSFLNDFGPALMNLDTAADLPELTEAELLEREAGYVITRAGLDALETALIVPDDGEDTEEGPAGAQGAAEGAHDPFNQSEAFTPDTKERADWVLCKIADARGRAARIREHAETMARQAEAEAERLEWKYGPALQDLARRELAGGRLKTLTLYHGQIGFRRKPASVQVVDTGAALAWARENLPEAVTEALNRKALSAALLDTGEALPFAAFTPAEETFFIR